MKDQDQGNYWHFPFLAFIYLQVQVHEAAPETLKFKL